LTYNMVAWKDLSSSQQAAIRKSTGSVSSSGIVIQKTSTPSVAINVDKKTTTTSTPAKTTTTSTPSGKTATAADIIYAMRATGQTGLVESYQTVASGNAIQTPTGSIQISGLPQTTTSSSGKTSVEPVSSAATIQTTGIPIVTSLPTSGPAQAILLPSAMESIQAPMTLMGNVQKMETSILAQQPTVSQAQAAMATVTAAPTSQGWISSLKDISSRYEYTSQKESGTLKGQMFGAGAVITGFGVGVLEVGSAVLPWNWGKTATGLYQTGKEIVTNPFEFGGKIGSKLNTSPGLFIGEIGGQVVGGFAIGEIVPKTASWAISKTSSGKTFVPVESVTSTDVLKGWNENVPQFVVKSSEGIKAYNVQESMEAFNLQNKFKTAIGETGPGGFTASAKPFEAGEITNTAARPTDISAQYIAPSVSLPFLRIGGGTGTELSLIPKIPRPTIVYTKTGTVGMLDTGIGLKGQQQMFESGQLAGQTLLSPAHTILGKGEVEAGIAKGTITKNLQSDYYTELPVKMFGKNTPLKYKIPIKKYEVVNPEEGIMSFNKKVPAASNIEELYKTQYSVASSVIGLSPSFASSTRKVPSSVSISKPSYSIIPKSKVSLLSTIKMPASYPPSIPKSRIPLSKTTPYTQSRVPPSRTPPGYKNYYGGGDYGIPAGPISEIIPSKITPTKSFIPRIQFKIGHDIDKYKQKAVVPWRPKYLASITGEYYGLKVKKTPGMRSVAPGISTRPIVAGV